LPLDSLLGILLKVIGFNCLTAEVVEVVEEVSNGLSLECLRQILRQLNASSQTDEVQFRIDKFAIEVATSCMRDGFKEEAMSMVSPLIEKPALTKDLEMFFNHAGCDAELVELFRMAFIHNLSKLERPSMPKGLVEVLESLDGLLKYWHSSALKDRQLCENYSTSLRDLLESREAALRTEFRGELSRVAQTLEDRPKVGEVYQSFA